MIYYTDLEWAISLNRCMLKIIGLWPKESKIRCEELLSKIQFLFNVIMLIFVLTIPALMSLIKVWGDMILMIDNLQYTLPLLITMLKVFIMWYNKGGILLFNKLIYFSLLYFSPFYYFIELIRKCFDYFLKL